MPILVKCPQGHQLRVPDSKANVTIVCPRCRERIRVPAADGQPPATAQPKSPTPMEAAPQPPPVVDPPSSVAPVAVATVSSSALVSPSARKQNKWTKQWLSNAAGYQVDRGRRTTANWLAISMAAMALFTMAPAMMHLNLREAPGWSNVVLLLALLQLAYAAWFALAPDFSTAWVAMFAFAGIAVIYAAATAITLNARPGNELILDLGELCRTMGNKPTLWSLAVVLVASTMAYFSGSFSHRWRKSARLEVAGGGARRS